MNYQHIDLSQFPITFHRIVTAWFLWQGVSLRKRNSYPGAEHRIPERWETAEQVFWGARPPRMIGDFELAFLDDADISYYLVGEDDVYYIDEKERGSRGRYWMFRKFEDVEKCMLFLISQKARPGRYSESPRFRWYKKGLNPRVSLSKPDPLNFPGRVSMIVDQEPIDRGWMGENDAIAFSHAIVMTYEELDSVLRDGIPESWFNLDFTTD